MTTLLLKEYLDHLNEETLRDFQWHLREIEMDGSKPIPISRLPENSSRRTTVDKLVEVFGEDDAVKRTVETLREIQHNDLASKLEKAKENQSMKQREEEPETSSAREKPREVDPTISECLSSLFADHMVRQCSHSQAYINKDLQSNIFGEYSPSEEIIHEINPFICGNFNDIFQFQTPSENIGENQEDFKKVNQWRDSSIENTLTQYFNEDKQTKLTFKMLRAMLDKEEKTRRAALRRQTRQEICRINWLADRTKHELNIKANRRCLVNKRLTKTLHVCTVFIISVLLVVGIGWTLTIFTTPAPCVKAPGKPPARSLGEDVEQPKKEQK